MTLDDTKWVQMSCVLCWKFSLNNLFMLCDPDWNDHCKSHWCWSCSITLLLLLLLWRVTHSSDESLSLSLSFMCVFVCTCVCVCSLGRPCCGTGTAWQLLTQGTWPSSPTMRSKHGYRSSFTSLAGERHKCIQMYLEVYFKFQEHVLGAVWVTVIFANFGNEMHQFNHVRVFPWAGVWFTVVPRSYVHPRSWDHRFQSHLSHCTWTHCR